MAFARSIGNVDVSMEGDATTISVSFEAGETGADHAIYVAYDTVDRGATIAGWADFQRIGHVAEDATSASFTLLPSLASSYGVARVFLVESAYPFDTLVESLRQTGTQWFDTGVTPGPTTFAAIDFQFDSVGTAQQRPFGISSDDATAGFSFDTYLNGSGHWASACKDGGGNWLSTYSPATTARWRISLDAVTGTHVAKNLETGAVLTKTHATTRSATSAGTLPVFAHRYFAGGTSVVKNFPRGGRLYSFVISNGNTRVGSYLPCMLGGRAGMYNAVGNAIVWSAGTDDFEVGGGAVPCAPAPGETLVGASAAFSLVEEGAYWKGSASGSWNGSDANWTVNGTSGQTWADGLDAVFADSADTRTVTIPGTVTPASVTFRNAQDYSISGSGGIAGTGTFVKYGAGTLTISGVNNSFTGDVLLSGGTTILSGNKDSSDITSGALGNPRVARMVTVSNATLNVSGKNPFGGGGRSQTPIQSVLKLYGATLELTPNFAFNVGDLYLHDSTVVVHGGYPTSSAGGRWGSLSAANIYFSGTHAMTLQGRIEGTAVAQGYAGLLLGKFAQATIDVPDMTGDADPDVYIKMPIFFIAANATGDRGIASGFRKTGAGTLELGGRDVNSHVGNSDYIGNVDVVEGTLKMSYGVSTYPFSRNTAFGAAQRAHTFTVHPGATLQFADDGLQGQFFATNAITIHVNGGTLRQDDNLANGLGKLILENATLQYYGAKVENDYAIVNGNTTNRFSLTWPTFGFNGGVSFLGTNAYILADGTVGGNRSRLFFGTDDGMPSDIFVAEISGKGTPDDTPDVTIKARLEDAPPVYATTPAGNMRVVTGTTHAPLALNMRKTGPGMLCLGDTSRFSTTTGRIEVAEGTLRIDGKMQSYEANFECPANTPLGDLRNPNRTALVLSGGTLWLTQSDTFGQGSTVNFATFAVTNGTIRQSAGAVNPLPFLDLYDATLDYSGHNSGNGGDIAAAHPWGTFIFSQRVRFDGTRPYDLQNRGGTCYFSLGWQSDSYQVPNGDYTEQHGKTEFYVADITRDANPDVTIGVVLKYPDRWNGNAANSKYSKTNFRTGLLKTGSGTLRLNSADATHYYAEATRVNGGTLLVDSHTFNSTNVFVQSGAFIGGTGTVARVTIEAGGGFTAVPGQARALTVQAAQLPADGVVSLDIPYLGDLSPVESVHIPIVSANALAGAKWRTTLNGADASSKFSLSAKIRDGIVYGSISRKGLCIVVR